MQIKKGGTVSLGRSKYYWNLFNGFCKRWCASTKNVLPGSIGGFSWKWTGHWFSKYNY
jgi:hypothetical protein